MRAATITLLLVCLTMTVGCNKNKRKSSMSRVPTVTTVDLGDEPRATVPDGMNVEPAALEDDTTIGHATGSDSPYISLPSVPEPGSGTAAPPAEAYSSTPAAPSTSYSSEPVIISNEPVYGGTTGSSGTVNFNNAAPPAPVYQPAPAAPQAGGGTPYTVQKGDTLWNIAKRHYGDGRRWTEIAAANNISNAKKLSVGQTLMLP